MNDLFREVYTRDVVRKLQDLRNPTPYQTYRLDVLTAPGERYCDYYVDRRCRHLRAKKAAWDVYLSAACDYGLLNEDLRIRLTGLDDENFRGALAECRAAWYFSRVLRLSVSAISEQRGIRKPDFRVTTNKSEEFFVEVKAPFKEKIYNQVIRGDDSDLIQAKLRDANKQFSLDCPNVLVIVPDFRISVSSSRYQLTRALYGEMTMKVPIPNFDSPTPVSEQNLEPWDEFNFNGDFVKQGRGKPPNKPAFTRVSAVITLEPEVLSSSSFGRHSERDLFEFNRCLVMHNANAKHQLSPQLFSGCPQFLLDGEHLKWNDGHRVAF